jgi:hypothetical protein
MVMVFATEMIGEIRVRDAVLPRDAAFGAMRTTKELP